MGHTYRLDFCPVQQDDDWGSCQQQCSKKAVWKLLRYHQIHAEPSTEYMCDEHARILAKLVSLDLDQ
jgi:hypothetical protein